MNCGKDLIEYKSKSFDAIFPLSVRKIAIERFIAELSNNDQNNISIFEFVFISGKTNQIEFFRYKFKIASSLSENNLILYGAFDMIDQNVIIISDRDEPCLHSFSHSLNNLLCLNEDCMRILRSEDIYITLKDIFMIMKKEKSNYNCIIDYNSYGEQMNKYLSFLSECYQEGIASTINDMQENLLINKNQTKKIILKLLLSHKEKNESIDIYSVEKESNENTKEVSGSDANKKEDYSLYATKIISSSKSLQSSSNNSSSINVVFNVKDKNNSSQEKNSKKKFLIRGYKLSQFYLIILNVAIVILLIANLITQNKLKTNITKLLSSYFALKRFKLFFSQSLLIIFSNLCLCTTNQCNQCINFYNQFIKFALPSLGLKDPSIYKKYLQTDLLIKVTELRASFQKFKTLSLNAQYNNLSIETIVTYFNVF